MNKLVLFILGLFLLPSCNQIIDYNIPEDQLSIYKINDIVFYKDRINNKIDTFRLEISKTYWGSDHSTYQYYYVHYFKLKNKNEKDYMYTAQTVKGMTISIINSDFNGNRYDFSTITNYIQTGITYPSVFYANMRYIPDSIPNAVYYTFKYGVLRYEYKDGRIYELMKK
jgi:hypothetical protein